MRIYLVLASLVILSGLVAASGRAPADGGDIEITPIIHASVQIEYSGTVIQIDPWSAGDMAKAKPADLILITDDPVHHLDVAAIERLRKPGAPIVMPASGKEKIPDGIVLPNGERTTAARVPIQSIASYDIKQGEPSHPKGNANGYLVTLGGKRIYFAGVTECVPELQALKDIDVAFIPMNIPLERMTPAAAADCVKILKPKIVYLYHYDQGYAARLTNPRATPPSLPGGLTIAQSVAAFKNSLKGTEIEFRDAAWYPTRLQ